MQSLSAIFVGDGSLLIRCAEIYLRAGHSAVAVVTANRQVADWAREGGVAVIEWPERGSPDLGDIEFDCLFSIANLRIVAPEMLARAKRRAINFHDSLLPAYAGLNATSWAIMAGEAGHGITWHEMTGEVDGGRILRQRSFPLAPDDTAFTLNAKCYEAAAESFAVLVEELARDRVAVIEPRGATSYFGRKDRPRGAATIDFTRPAREIVALVRALDFGAYPNPLARPKLLVGENVLLARSAELVPGRGSAVPGRMVPAGEDRVVLSCADADVVLSGLTALDGGPPQEVLRRNRLDAGGQLSRLDAERLAAVTALDRRAASAEPWWSRELARLGATAVPYPRRADRPAAEAAPLRIRLKAASAALSGFETKPEQVVAGYIGWVARVTGQPSPSLRYVDAELAESVRGLEAWFEDVVPMYPAATCSGLVSNPDKAALAASSRIRGGAAAVAGRSARRG